LLRVRTPSIAMDLLLKDYKPHTTLATKNTTPARARFPVIDVNNQLGKFNYSTFQLDPDQEWNVKDIPAALAIMDEMNVHCVVNLSGGWGDMLQENLERYKYPYPDRFCIFTNIDWKKVDEPNFGEKWAKTLEKSVRAGAQGLKVYKTLGLRIRDSHGKLLYPDDTRFDPIWETAGELKIPVLIHCSDPVAFFEPLNAYNERYEELVIRPDWLFNGKDFPGFMDLIERFLNLVENHPRTTFIGAHVMSYAENLGFVEKALKHYPNLYVDITERIAELGRQPYSARAFLVENADRVLFGSDYPPNKTIYQTNFRFLETDDEYFEYGRNQGRWRIYGVFLPDEALSKIYYKNASKLIPGIKV
jgi:predicted TIM-barrel fold metal-dependent hydrolase